MQDAFSYDERILDELRGHGLRPLPTTPPSVCGCAQRLVSLRDPAPAIRASLPDISSRRTKRTPSHRAAQDVTGSLSVPDRTLLDKGRHLPCRTSRSSASSISAGNTTSAGKRPARPAALRLEGPDDARGLRGDDRQRQDGALPRAAGRGGDRRHPGDRDRPQGGPRQPAADASPSCAAEDFRPWVDPDEAARKGLTARAVRRRRPPSPGRRAWPTGARTAARIERFRDAADLAIYTPGQQRRAAADGAALVRRAAAGPGRATARRYRERVAVGGLGAAGAAGDRRRPALAAASTSCSPTARPRLADGPRPRLAG